MLGRPSSLLLVAIAPTDLPSSIHACSFPVVSWQNDAGQRLAGSKGVRLASRYVQLGSFHVWCVLKGECEKFRQVVVNNLAQNSWELVLIDDLIMELPSLAASA